MAICIRWLDEDIKRALCILLISAGSTAITEIRKWSEQRFANVYALFRMCFITRPMRSNRLADKTCSVYRAKWFKQYLG